MRRLPVSVLAALCLLLASATAAWSDLSKLDPIARRALAGGRAGAAAKVAGKAGFSTNVTRELDVFVVGDVSRAELEAAGARVRTELPGLFTAWIPEDAVERVTELAGVHRIRGAVRMKKNLNLSVPTTNAPFMRGAAPDFAGLNGAGVIIGDVDTGVDYDHGDFKNPDGTTRLIDIWDQTDAGGPHPAGFAYGSEWNPTTINNHTARQIDDDGHGTHVLGIAGGDGSATGGAVPAFTYVGMAPKADLVMVRTDFNDTGIIDGIAYVFARATALGKNAVVNLSLGTLYGPKDGTSPFEAAVNALTGPGHIVVVSAGNDGNFPVHAEVISPTGGAVSTTVEISSSFDGAIVALDGYYAASGSLRVSITTPSGDVVGPVSLGGVNAAYPGTLTSDGNVYLENGLALTATGDRQVYVELSVPDPNNTFAFLAGEWTFTFANGAPTSHDETTEDHTGSAQWNATGGAAATPGSVAGGVTGAHLLISEVGMRGLNSATLTDSTEFLEIYNPTTSSVDLSNSYLCDNNMYYTLPVAGTITLGGINTDFAMKFPNGSSIGAGQAKVIAIDGGRYRRGTGVNADFMLFNAGGTTTAVAMTDVATNKGSGYPGFGSLTNAAEFVWLFSWDGASDLVCDKDLVYWGSGTGGNIPTLKFASFCQDGPDAGTATSCYNGDVGNPSGSMTHALIVPASGNGTRQRDAAEGTEGGPGNGCSVGGGGTDPPVEVDQWIFYADVDAQFFAGAQPDQELIGEPGNAANVITVGAWATKINWTDCGGRSVSYSVPPTLNGIADFSSQGPTRDGREKPDITAPGIAIASANDFDVPVVCPGFPSGYLNDAMQHQILEGTSMAAPHVAGAVALLMQKLGTLTPAQVKTYLNAHAVTDGFTGTVWNSTWGHGKLALGDLTDPVAHVDAPNGGESYNVGTNAPLTWTATDAYQGVTQVDLYLTRNDGNSYEPIALAQPNTGSYNWTVTGPTTTQARLRVIARDAATNFGQDMSDALFSITAATGVPSVAAITEFALAVRSSNPAPGAIRVEFAVPHESNVGVGVYDLLGRKIAALASGRFVPGRYEVRWPQSGASAQSGVYFIRLETAEREIVKRVAIAR